MNTAKIRYMVALCGALLLVGCSGSQYLTVSRLHKNEAVKIYLDGGESFNALVVGRSGDELTYVAEADHQIHSVAVRRIRRIQALDKYYDEQAYPISMAEIEKYKTNRNTYGYALGGAVIGGASGLIFGLPFWYADIGGVPPYFVAGSGAVVGSIYFAFQGQQKDREEAVKKIRYIRQRERKLQEELEKEKEKLRKLEEEKKKLREKLEDNRHSAMSRKKLRADND